MERAPLKPVPRRPEGPVDPDQALAFVGRRLPDLDGEAQRALALVELAQRAPDDTGFASGELGAALARGRKALRRALFPLPGSGWCERAERLISDRLDDRLEDPGPARLDAHLANCSRCVEHELRLAQSIDALVGDYVAAHPAPAPPRAAPEPAEWPSTRLEVPTTPALPPPELTVVEESSPPPAAPVQAPAEPTPAPTAEPPEPIPTAEREPVVAGALAWRALYALAVLLALATLVLTALGIAGVDPL